MCYPALASQSDGADLKAFINTIQLAVFGSDSASLGEALEGVYREAWQAIVALVEEEEL